MNTIRYIIKSFFFSKNKFQPVYCWTTILMILIVTSFIQLLLGYSHIKESTLIALMGFVTGLLGLYNLYQLKKQ